MSTIKQKTVSVSVGDGQSVEVRRMKWKAAREFLKKLAAAASTIAPKITDIKEGDPAKRLNFVTILPQLLTHSEEISAHVFKHSTDLTAEQSDELALDDALRVVMASLMLNFYDEELKNFFAGIGQNLVGNSPRPSAPEGQPGPVTTT